MTVSVGRVLVDWRLPASNDTDPLTSPSETCHGLNIQLLAVTDEEIARVGRPATASARDARTLLIAGRNRRAATCRACGVCPGSESVLTLPRPD
jgi:hypothetical protein